LLKKIEKRIERRNKRAEPAQTYDDLDI